MLGFTKTLILIVIIVFACLEATSPQNNSCTSLCLPPCKRPKKYEQDTLGAAEEIRVNFQATFPHGVWHVDAPVLTNKQKLALYSSLWILGAVYKSSQERHMTGTDGEGDSRTFVQSVRLEVDWLFYGISTLMGYLMSNLIYI